MNKGLLIGKVESGSKFRSKIEELYFKVFTDYPWYDEIEPEDSIMICKRYFDDDRYTVLGGLENGELIGLAVIKDIESSKVDESISKFNKYGFKNLYIEEVGIDPDRQKQGLGREIIKYILEKYPNYFLYFTTNNSPNSPMGKLTQSLGFEFVKDEKNNIRVFSQDEGKGSPTKRCALFYNNIQKKNERESEKDEER